MEREFRDTGPGFGSGPGTGAGPGTGVEPASGEGLASSTGGPARSHKAFRGAFRVEHFQRGYSGYVHIGSALILGAVGAVLLLSWVRDPSALELLTVPITVLYANVVEYFGHKGPMHRRYRRFRLLSGMFQRHAAEHHIFFTREQMEADGPDDWQIILAHPVFLVFFLGLIGLPSGLALALIAPPNVLWLFAATATVYAVSYEALHLAYHLPPDSLVGRFPGVRFLRHQHLVHHDPKLMTRYNFNITIPLVDWIAGTWARDAEPAAGPERSAPIPPGPDLMDLDRAPGH